MRNILSILILFCLLNSCRNHQEVFVIQNDVFQKTIGFSKEKPDKISVELNFSEEKNSISEKDHPYFEFVIKNQLVSSNDKLWIFTNHSEREMGNGGTEHILTFEGIKEPVKGLQVVLFQQVFPNSTLMREKLELKAAGNTFTLNKLEGKLHFKFPCYSVKNRSGEIVESTEIRMASFEKKPITFGNDKGNHMFYPDIIQTEVSENKQLAKGPVSIVT
ncbi:MAG TPA: hypothetical protein VK872_13015, partial [Draconibacterium sp.]|nr:hypothetical protein [Draconibacterium sp.]